MIEGNSVSSLIGARIKVEGKVFIFQENINEPLSGKLFYEEYGSIKESGTWQLAPNGPYYEIITTENIWGKPMFWGAGLMSRDTIEQVIFLPTMD